MRTMALVVLSLAFSYSAQASRPTSQADADKALAGAILLAGPSIAGLPVVLAAVPPDEASRGVEGWTVYDRDGHAERIVVYRESELFGCASDRDRKDYQCLLRLASTIIHEAWRYRYGLDEAGACDAQIAFLALHGGSSAQIGGVRARARLCHCCPTGHRTATELNRPSRSRTHDERRARPVVRRRYSHARAVCHSRVTVAREIESTAATCCSDKPPKYRSSTI
jgi:hypothetical protein